MKRAGADRLALCLAATAVTLVAGYLLKAECGSIIWDGRQYGLLCYNDVQALYGARGLAEESFVYVHGRLTPEGLQGGAIEYPVLTGVFMWITARLAGSFESYLAVTALALAPVAVLVTVLLHDLCGRRALLWAAAPALMLYAFHNWDLLAVAALVSSVWLWHRGRPTGAALAAGLGAAFKLYPGLLLAPLVLERIARGDRRGAVSAAGAGVGAFAAANLPFALANFDGWWATYAFHARRVADFNAFYTWGLSRLALDPRLLNLVSLSLTAASAIIALAYGHRRAGRGEGYPLVPTGAAMVASFMLWSKVHSPQYALWILPFFALLSVHVGWWIAYSAADLAVYVGIFRWFYDFSLTGDQDTWTAAKITLVAGVWARAALLGALFVVFLRARFPGAVARATARPAAVLSNQRRRNRPRTSGKREKGGARI